MQQINTNHPDQIRFEPWILHYAYLAHQAMLSEVNLTPKPGLVDLHNNGSHHDMDLQTFYRSANTIAQWYPYFIQLGVKTHQLPANKLLTLIRLLGIQCEKAMFTTTNNVNTHKGSIFSMGILLVALGRLSAKHYILTAHRLCQEVADLCQNMVSLELVQCRHFSTAGQRLYQKFGFTGARGEAQSGFQSVLAISLPAYQSTIHRYNNTETALHQALLSLMATNDDTNIASRGGIDGLTWFKASALNLLAQGGVSNPNYLTQLVQFDCECIKRNLSPGGSADLLVITHFLAQIKITPYRYE